MSRRALIYIIAGVIMLHLAAFFVLRNVKPLPKYKMGPVPLKPNFKSYERVEVDAATGEKTIYRDIQVSTKLTPRESLPQPEPVPAPAEELEPEAEPEPDAAAASQ